MYNGILWEAKGGKSLKNNYNFGYVKYIISNAVTYTTYAAVSDVRNPADLCG